MSPLSRHRMPRQGLSLMEVIVAVAILGAAMGVIGNLVYLGSKAATNARQISEAQILGDTKMAELSAGILPLSSSSFTTITEAPDWVFSVDIGNTNINGLLQVTVTVQQSPAVTSNPTPFTLMRWLPDPDYEPEQSVLQ